VKISAMAEYACLALITLAQRRLGEKPVTIREIADSHRIPESFLNQILLELKGAGIVRSTRGSSGGYRLARPPEQIKLDEVLDVIDGYASAERELQGPAAHVLAEVWSQLRTSKVGILSGTSIAQLAERINPRDWVI
jgi:Rrf2 family transcriptional regulator, cysteine metabolism repressor